MPLTRISITIPEELVQAADQLAEGLDRSRSWVLVDALRRYLGDRARPVARVAEPRVQYRGQAGGREHGQVVDAAREVAYARSRRLEGELETSPLERLQRAEELGRLGRQMQRRVERAQVIGFSSYDDFYEWKRARQIGT